MTPKKPTDPDVKFEKGIAYVRKPEFGTLARESRYGLAISHDSLIVCVRGKLAIRVRDVNEYDKNYFMSVDDMADAMKVDSASIDAFCESHFKPDPSGRRPDGKTKRRQVDFQPRILRINT